MPTLNVERSGFTLPPSSVFGVLWPCGGCHASLLQVFNYFSSPLFLDPGVSRGHIDLGAGSMGLRRSGGRRR